jgi:uncharacterized membrane protein YbhN (UPF0104 family)
MIGNPQPKRRPALRTIAQNLLIYGIAGGLIWYEIHGIPFHKLLLSIANANLLWFVPTTFLSLCIWFFGENLIYTRMFSYFHEKTGYFEVMPATAASYFLQVVNILLAGGSLVLFLHRRKHAPWLAATFTLLFLGFIDGIVFSFLILLSALFVRNSPLKPFLPYAAGAFGAFSLIAMWWMCRKPTTRFERWLHDRPALASFRNAKLRIYLELGAIRLGIFTPQALVFWICMAAFHIAVPLLTVFAATPAILAAGGLPFTPVGLGPLQAIAVHEFSRFASTGRILGVFLLFSAFLLAYRLPLGISSARPYVKTVLATGGEEHKDEHTGEATSAGGASSAR